MFRQCFFLLFHLSAMCLSIIHVLFIMHFLKSPVADRSMPYPFTLCVSHPSLRTRTVFSGPVFSLCVPRTLRTVRSLSHSIHPMLMYVMHSLIIHARTALCKTHCFIDTIPPKLQSLSCKNLVTLLARIFVTK